MDEREVRLVERQQRWELSAVDRGIERYRLATQKAVGGGRLADTKPGMRMLSAILENLIPAIQEARTEAQQGFGSGARNIPHWWMPFLSLSAEKMAYIVVARSCRIPI